MDDEIRASALTSRPTGRLGTPRDVANLVSLLLSDRGRWINGQLMSSNGGLPTGRLPC